MDIGTNKEHEKEYKMYILLDSKNIGPLLVGPYTTEAEALLSAQVEFPNCTTVPEYRRLDGNHHTHYFLGIFESKGAAEERMGHRLHRVHPPMNPLNLWK